MLLGGHFYIAANSVDRIYTDLCVIDVTKDGLKVIEKVEGLSFDELQALTGATLIDATQG
ncbi:3-oxoadipate CoA-transferase [Acinetobacter baumannii]|uniref:3-oxoadipate CoA-transferase n=1 Tax=Acinetobacter baumannii TaxID=470 RepID=A0AA45B8M6_ACIBA|nr:3-oxoadipate CoA-transferase [Acinetobacter baumannii]